MVGTILSPAKPLYVQSDRRREHTTTWDASDSHPLPLRLLTAFPSKPGCFSQIHHLDHSLLLQQQLFFAGSTHLHHICRQLAVG